MKSSRMGWAWHAARMREMINAHNISVGKPEGKRPRGMPKRRSEDNIRIDLRIIGWEGVYWMHLAEYRDR
jgi:hypothetical protein